MSRLSRAEEEAAMAAFIAAKGVTRLAEVNAQDRLVSQVLAERSGGNTMQRRSIERHWKRRRTNPQP